MRHPTTFKVDFCIPVQEGFYSDADSSPAVTAPGILLVVSSLGITIFYALGPGTYKNSQIVQIFGI